MKRSALSVGVWPTTGFDWRQGTAIPFIAKLYRTHASLGGLKQGFQWLPLRIGRNGSSFNELIQVPTKVESERDIDAVLSQFPTKPSIAQFGFLLGVLLGDAGKGMNLYIGEVHRIPSFNLLIYLTKRYQHNVRFAEYISVCCSRFGLSFHRLGDRPPSEKQLKSAAKSTNFSWRSERSPFFAWMHTACLGLGIHETTTKTPVSMEWSLSASETFRISFLQGVSESDGSASYNGYARIESWPNAPFMKSLIQSLGARCSLTKKGDRVAGVAITIDQAASIHLFSEAVASERYRRMMQMTQAQRLHGWPQEIESLVNQLSKTIKSPDITRRLLLDRNIFIRPGSINRHLRRMKSKPPPHFF